MFTKALVPIDLKKLDQAKTAIDAAQKLAPQMTAELIILAMEADEPKRETKSNASSAKAFEHFIDDQSSRLQRIVDGRYCRGRDLISEINSIVDREGIDLVVMPSKNYEKIDQFLGASGASVVEKTPCSVLMLR